MNPDDVRAQSARGGKAVRRRSGNPAKATSAPAARRGPATAAEWVAGARLRTLPLAIAPVALGTGAGVVALPDGPWHPARALLALVVALALQIAVNYANDYSDGVRGTDDHRVGPARLTGSGAAKPKHVLAVALSFFAIAALAGLALTIVTQQWWMLAIGAVAIVAAWFYTGGKRPYGYYGLGELVVFVFFGLVATAGSAYVQALTVNLEAWLGGVGAGLIACAVLMANNLRDVTQDKAAGKRTLAVLVGPLAGRILFVVFMLVPFAIAAFFALLYPLAWLVLFALLAALPACLIVLTAKTPRELLLALQLASLTALVYGVGLGLAFAL
jgi:1,4-dihydroxy-2-naphthoate octaprenyltransferase